jgi:hypothetical protein
MIVVSSRAFREQQRSYLDKVDSGAEVLIQRGKDKAYKVTLVTEADVVRSSPGLLENAVMCLYNDYKHDDELTIFTQLDCEDFYEAR